MRILTALFLAMTALSLQGCVPVVAGGVGTTALMAEDRRTAGTYIEDEGIELKADKQLGEKFKDQAHINITSFNRSVLLTGEAAGAEMKSEIEKIVRGLPNVRNVTNEIAVAGTSSMTSRANDTYLTSKVKARFLDTSKFQSNHVKVVTESNVVYLMGLVKRQEAEDAAEIARTTGGVQKVVTVFEYLD